MTTKPDDQTAAQPFARVFGTAPPAPAFPSGTVQKPNKTNAPEWVVKGRVPYLDGLRALAIAAVIAYHMGCGLNIGHQGVTLFFVISGFLITLLMLRENDRTGTISLLDFYWRRTLRIMPALLLFLLIVLALQYFGLVHIPSRYWVAAFTYTMCYVDRNHVPASTAGDIIHTWSLSVEEHFYLLWPLIFCIGKPAKAFKVLFAYLLLVPCIRYLGFRYFNDSNFLDIKFASITEMGSIGIGCVVAFAVHGDVFQKLNAKARQYPRTLLIFGLIFVIGQMVIASTTFHVAKLNLSKLFENVFGDPMSALGFALVLLSAVYIPNNALLSRVLNWRPLVFIGTLSYSIYLWQQLFTGYGMFAHRPGLWNHPTITLSLIASCSLVSYYAIEVPFLHLKYRKISSISST